MKAMVVMRSPIELLSGTATVVTKTGWVCLWVGSAGHNPNDAVRVSGEERARRGSAGDELWRRMVNEADLTSRHHHPPHPGCER